MSSFLLIGFYYDRPSAVAASKKAFIVTRFADLGFQGSPDIPTPHIDSIVRNGVRCTSGYVSHPFCSPTRAGLMTGRYQERFGFLDELAHPSIVFDPRFAPLLEKAMVRQGLSARAHDRILKVSRTIADLDTSENIRSNLKL